MSTFNGQWAGCKTFTPVSGRPTVIRVANRCVDCTIRPVYRQGKRCIACADDARHNRRTIAAVKLEGEAMYLKLKRSGVNDCVAWKMAYGEDY